MILIYYIGLNEDESYHAGTKAPNDIKELCRRRGYQYLGCPPPNTNPNAVIRKASNLNQIMKFWQQAKKVLKSGDIVIYQHPMFGAFYSGKILPELHDKGIRLIALIHDLESLRYFDADNMDGKTASYADITFLKMFDAVICHNTKMKQYLVQQGFESQKLICLEIFDYLSATASPESMQHDAMSVAVAGNLAKEKSNYIYSLADGAEDAVSIHLYGANFEGSSKEKNLEYFGSFPAEELPVHLHASYGLVWDGNAADTCAGQTGKYLKYNNPHKTSLYLSSGLPVVIWEQAAMADFILAHHVGITVASLKELKQKINSVSEEEYKSMLKNTAVISEKLRAGHYFYTALDACLALLESK